MKTVVFAGPRLFMKFGDLEYFRSRAETAGIHIAQTHADDDEVFVREVKCAHAIAVIARRIDSAIIDQLENCELIQTLSVGYDCVDTDAATAAGIRVCNTPAYCTEEVASHAMTLLLALTRKLHAVLPATRGGVWDYNFTKPLFSTRGKRLGIIGLGRIGRAIVGKARGFGMEVGAFDPYLDDDIFRLLGVDRFYELDDLLSTCDYVSVHAPLTEETRGMIGIDELRLMKPTALVVNTARGPLWDEHAVVTALRDGVIAGAATDVLVSEPPDPSHPFLLCDQMIVTPHVAWYSEESFRKNMEDSMDEIVRVLTGKRARWVVNPEVLARRG